MRPPLPTPPGLRPLLLGSSSLPAAEMNHGPAAYKAAVYFSRSPGCTSKGTASWGAHSSGCGRPPDFSPVVT